MIRFILGYLLLAAATIPVVVACHRMSRRLVTGTWERLTITLFLVSLQIVLSMQLLGAMGQWRPLPYLIIALLGAGAMELSSRRIRPTGEEADNGESGETDTPQTPLPKWLKIVAVAAPVALVTAAVVNLLFAPDTANDSSLYHRAMVAAWHRTNTIWRIGAFENGVYEGAYWSNGDLFGMWTTIPFGRDYLLQVVSLVWAGGLFAAMVAAARSVRLDTWSAVLVASAVFCAWGVTVGQLSTFHVDLLSMQAGVVMFWAGLLWLGLGTDSPGRAHELRWMVLAGLAAGLAAGTKQAALPYAGLCVLVLAVTAIRRKMWGHAGIVVACAVLPTLIWPVRNLIMTGNPLWPLAIGSLPGAEPGYTAADVNQSVLGLGLSDPGMALATLLVALILAYGPLLVMLVIGWRKSLEWARSRGVVWFTIVAPVVALAAYLVTPHTGFARFQFFITMRFLAPQIAALVVVLAAATLLRGPKLGRWRMLFGVAVLYGAFTVALSHAAPGIFQWPLWAWIVAAATAGAAGFVVSREGPHRVPPRRLIVAGAVACGLLVAVALPARASNWYPFHSGVEDVEPAAAWFDENEPTGKNIAFVGVLSGWMHGRDMSNNVFYLAKPTDNHGVTHWDDKSAWESALQAACTDYLVVSNDANKWGRPLPEFDWAAASEILEPVELSPAHPEAKYEVRVYEVQRDPGARCSPPT